MKKLLLLLLAFNCQAYDRHDYGGWKDFDKNCVDTRTEVLINQAKSIDYTNCNIIYGTWLDVYTGKLIIQSHDIDIDHVIPLKYADSIGASIWNSDTKQKFANDLDNLLATSKHMNRSKGSKGLSQWLPPDDNYKCTYIKKWITLSNKYSLILKHEDVNIIEKYKDFCKF